MQADAGEDLCERAVRVTRGRDFFATPDIVSVADPPSSADLQGGGCLQHTCVYL